jgi:hypothetical protein
MKTLIQLEIGFYKEDQAYISIDYKPSKIVRQFQEILLFTGYTLKQMANIDPNNPICQSLAETYKNLQPENAGSPISLTVAPPYPSFIKPGGLDLITVSTRDIKIVERHKIAQKRFTARVDNEDVKVKFWLNHYGFGPLGKGINYYVPVSIVILLDFLANRENQMDLAFYLAAKRCGEMAVEKVLGLGNSWDLACFITKSLYKA